MVFRTVLGFGMLDDSWVSLFKHPHGGVVRSWPAAQSGGVCTGQAVVRALSIHARGKT